MATRTWDNGGGDGLWSNPTNWSSNTKPVAGDSVVFDGTSTANCTIDEDPPSLVDFSINTGYTYSAGVSGTITASGTRTITLTGNLNRANVGKIVFGSGSTWNIAGHFDSATTGPAARDDYSGATVNLTGSGKTLGIVSCAGAGRGTVNIAVGASYNQENGEVGGVDFHNYGTHSSSSELNINRNSAKLTKVYNHAGGTFSGVGTIIFTASAQWLQQDGTVSIAFGIIKPNSTTSLVPGTYGGGTFNLYRQGTGTQIFYWSNGTYNITGNVVSVDDGFSGTSITYDNTAGATINCAGFDLTTALGGVSWTPSYGTGRINITGTTTINSNGQQLDTIGVSTGTVTLGANLSALGIVQTGGTLAGNSKTVTLRDQDIWTGGSRTGVAGKTWTLNGSLYWSGITATAASAWTLAGISDPLYTFNADTCTIDHVTVTGATMQASHSTNAGNNTGITFSNTSRQRMTILARAAVTPAAGSHTVEADCSVSGTLTARLDGVSKFTFTLTPTGTKFGVWSHFDTVATSVLCPVDTFDVPRIGVPAAPASLSVTTAGLATWHVATGATSYTLEESSTGSGSGFSAISSAQSGVSYQRDISALHGLTRYYRVKATNASGDGAYSSEASVTYPALTLMQDGCSGTNGDSFNGRTPDTAGSGTWSIGTGTVTVQSNTMQFASGSVTGAALYDAGQANVSLQFTNKSTSAGVNFRTLRVALRATNYGNYIGLQIQSGVMKLIKVTGFGAPSVLATLAETPAPNDVIKVSVDSSSKFTVTINGVLSASNVTDTTNSTATQVGFLGTNTNIGEVAVDDVLVTAP